MADQSSDSPNRANIEQSLENLLADFPAGIAEIFRLAAIPQWSDKALLLKLSGDEDALHATLDIFADFPLIERDQAGRFYYHDVLRDYMLGWWGEQPKSYAAKNQLALAYFQELVDGANPVERPAYEREVFYHLLVADGLDNKHQGLAYIQTRFESACDHYQFGTAEDLVAQLRGHQETLSSVEGTWLDYFSARLDLIFRRESLGKKTFQALVEQTNHGLLRGLAHWHLAEIQLLENDWSGAVSQLKMGLDSLSVADVPAYRARLMVTMGNIYLDLAKNSGGYRRGGETGYRGFRRLLNIVQQGPYMLFEWLFHRITFFPNLSYFGNNYQDWLITYLLILAVKWYREAERVFVSLADPLEAVNARIKEAEVEFEMGRWVRAEKKYLVLAESEMVINSRYRTAKILAGLGSIYQSEGEHERAIPALQEAVSSFRFFQDNQSLGHTSVSLAHSLVQVGEADGAAQAYLESLHAFHDDGDILLRTQTLWDVEMLVSDPSLDDEKRNELRSTILKFDRRQYITRFPKQLLYRFRQLASLIALPISYVLSLVVGLVLAYSLAFLEAWISLTIEGLDLGALGLVNALILLVGILLPLPIALWLFRLVYSLMGLVFVNYLGRNLIHIEKEQPEIVTLDQASLTVGTKALESDDQYSWDAFHGMTSVDTRLWQQPIYLVSRQFLTTADSQPLILEAATFGYRQLKREIARRLGEQAERYNLDFTIFRNWTSLLTLLFVVLYALIIVFQGEQIEMTADFRDIQVSLFLTPIFLVSLFSIYLVYPPVTLWRLIWHRRRMRKTLGYRARVAPNWIVWLAAVILSLVALAWFVIVPNLEIGQ